MIGAPSTILLDGLVEQESGKTPGPPAIGIKAIAITLLVMFVLGLALAFFALRMQPQLFAPIYRGTTTYEKGY